MEQGFQQARSEHEARTATEARRQEERREAVRHLHALENDLAPEINRFLSSMKEKGIRADHNGGGSSPGFLGFGKKEPLVFWLLAQPYRDTYNDGTSGPHSGVGLEEGGRLRWVEGLYDGLKSRGDLIGGYYLVDEPSDPWFPTAELLATRLGRILAQHAGFRP
jgi:hypothetical protein